MLDTDDPDMNWFHRILAQSKTPTVLDQAQAAAGTLIVAGYRRHAQSKGGAPSDKTSDSRIVAIYTKVGTAYRRIADERGERLSAGTINFIVWNWLQVYEMVGPALGDAAVDSELRDEVESYRKNGLDSGSVGELNLI